MEASRAQSLVVRHLSEGVPAQVIRFLVVGLASYFVNLGLYSLGLAIGLHYLAAATCAFLIGFVFNFLTNRSWTFSANHGNPTTQFLRFCAVQAVILGLDLILLRLAVENLGLARFPSQAVIIILLAPVSFVGNRRFAFR
jgi:putative flippase GtrA